MAKFRVGVIVAGTNTAAHNGLVFATRREAEDYAHDLMARWTLVISTVIQEIPVSAQFRITLDAHRCRPITADSWREALKVAIERTYGPRCWTPSHASIYDSKGYLDIYQAPAYRDRVRGETASSLVESQVFAQVERLWDDGSWDFSLGVMK